MGNIFVNKVFVNELEKVAVDCVPNIVTINYVNDCSYFKLAMNYNRFWACVV